MKASAPAELSDSLKKPFAVLSVMKLRLNKETGADYDKAFVTAAIKSFEDYRVRVTMDPGPGYFRPITPERREGINKFYEQIALSMYTGFANRMTKYAENGDEQQKRLAALFSEAQK
jgi:hypothetical protein